MRDKNKKDNSEETDDIVFDSEEEGSNPASLVKKLRQKIKTLETKSQEYLTGWQKERADSVNLRKRLEEEKKEHTKFAKEDISTELISVLDSFDSAFKNKEVWEKVDKNNISTLDTLPTPTPEATPAADIAEEETQEATESAQATSSAKITSTVSETTETAGYYYYVPAYYEWDVEMSQEQSSEIKN